MPSAVVSVNSKTRPKTRSELREAIESELSSLEAYALKLCLSRIDAADIVHDTVVRALRFEHSYQPGTNARAWLHRILFSVFVSRSRRWRRERRALSALSLDPCAWLRQDAPPPMNELSGTLRSAMKELPTAFRVVVTLVDLEERSYKSVSQALGIPLGTVMSRLFRARRLLANALGEERALSAAA